jgi:hypothetical protein
MSGAHFTPSQALGAAVRRNGHLIPGASALTPYDEMVRREDAEHSEEERKIREEAVSSWLLWVWEGGPGELERAVKRLITYTRTYRPELLLNMSMDQVAALLGQGRAAESARTKKAIGATLAKAGYRNTHLPTGKSPDACEKMARAQVGNRHRARSKRTPLL